MTKFIFCAAIAATAVPFGLLSPTVVAQSSASSTNAPAGVLNREDAAKILPPSVFYRGQTAPVQGRNSAGIRQPDGKLVLVALVDNSGYSTGIAERYQGTLITEVPLRVAGKQLAPGSYGFGFLPGNRMVVMDVGANQVLEVATTPDAAMKRPNPLQIIATGGQNRLYLGRNYVVLSPQ